MLFHPSSERPELLDGWLLPAPFGARLRAARCTLSRCRLPGDGAEALFFLPPGAPSACLVLAHGGGNDRLYGLWVLIEALLAQGLAVATAHLPGHGAGGADLFSVEAARARLDALVERAPAATGASRVGLLGQSLGGALALDHLARGGAADAYVAVSVPLALRWGPGVLFELAAPFRPAAWRMLRYVRPSEALPAFGPFGRERLPVRTAPGRPYLTEIAEALERLDLEERLALRAYPVRPVLIVHGTFDGIAPFAHAERLARALGPAASLVPLPGAGHFEPLLRRSVVAAVGGWLSGQWPSGLGPAAE